MESEKVVADAGHGESYLSNQCLGMDGAAHSGLAMGMPGA